MTATPATRIPMKVQTYLAMVCLGGIAAIAFAIFHWDSPDLLKFAGFLAVGLLSAGIEIPSPIAGGLPITFLFILIGAFELTPSETIALACIMTVVYSYWNRPQRPNLDQVAFQVAIAAIASTCITGLHSSPLLALQNIPILQVRSLEPALRVVLDIAAMFLLNTVPMIVAVSLSEDVPLISTWWNCSAWSFPYYVGGGLAAVLATLVGHFLGWTALLLAGPAVYLILRTYRLYVARLENERKHAKEVASLHLRTIEALALAIEAKDDTTHEHLARVQVYAKEMSRELGCTEEEQEALRAASILHDIGKLAVPEHIISKPGRLTPEEFEKMKIHPVVGAEILERVEFPYPVAPIVRAHHEKWDGSGYPYGLKGEDIPIGARILAVVDCLDALATDRQYRRALPLDEAMKIIQNDSGKAFDPRVVDLLARRYVTLEKMAKSQQQPEAAKLSTNVKFERGLAPAAGFESAAPNAAPAANADGANTSASGNSSQNASAVPGDFLSQIAAARQEMQTLFEISHELGSSLSLDETLSLLDAKLRRVIPYHSIAVWIRSKDDLKPEFVAGDDHRLFAALEIPVGQGLSGWVAENRKPILNGNPAVESGYLKDASRCSTLRSAIAIPLEGAGDNIGVLTLYHADRDAFTRDHLRILLATSSKIALSIENAIRFHKVESNSTTDTLTNLMNSRAMFVQLDAELSRARRSSTPVAVLVMDLDGFKSVNERFGQNEGDRILCSVGDRLRVLCRDYDLLARMGGDEFAMVLPGAHAGELDNKIELIRGMVAQATGDALGGETLTASIGVAYFPRDGAETSQLLSEAERRMYAEKSLHKQRKTGLGSTIFARNPEPNWLSTIH